MLFGLINISIIYQILINDTLADYLDIYAMIYLNIILTYLDILKDYEKYIKNILIELLDRRFRYKSKKWEPHKKISWDSLLKLKNLKMNSDKVKKVLG